MSGYDEVVKNLASMRRYVRQLYVYGFKKKVDYSEISGRTYDDIIRRSNAWFGGLLTARTDGHQRIQFLSVDSRDIPHNPLHRAFKTKSFTNNDIELHFLLLDFMEEHEWVDAEQVQELSDTLDSYDLKTLRTKLKELTQLGILRCRKNGKKLEYSLSYDDIDYEAWNSAVSFFTEESPLGVVGSYLLDKDVFEDSDVWRYKHHFIVHALDSEITYEVLKAIHSHKMLRITGNAGREHELDRVVVPIKFYISTQNGRQYLLAYDDERDDFFFYRIDYLDSIEILADIKGYDKYLVKYEEFKSLPWGASWRPYFGAVHHVEMIIEVIPEEHFLIDKINREKRKLTNSTVEQIDNTHIKFTVDTYDAVEMVTWVRSFIGRLVSFSCVDENGMHVANVEDRIWGDLNKTYELYLDKEVSK